MSAKRTGLGRGLDALLSTEQIVKQEIITINQIPIEEIFPNPDQPRKEFDAEHLMELSASIREVGIIQPITLQKVSPHKYIIIAGERRYRASKMAGVIEMPAYIRQVEDDTLMEMALIENIQREDLNAIEIAITLYKLIDQYKLTQEKLSERIGKKRTTIANYLRLLKLPAEIQQGIQERKIEMGHARALLSLDNPIKQIEIYKQIVANGYSVRKVEEIVKGQLQPTKQSAPKEVITQYEEEVDAISQTLNTKVKLISNSKGRGNISIPFKSQKELKAILDILNRL